jgi:hypothetical protein
MRWKDWMAIVGGIAAGYGGIRWLQAVDREIGRNLVVPLLPGIAAEGKENLPGGEVAGSAVWPLGAGTSAEWMAAE